MNAPHVRIAILVVWSGLLLTVAVRAQTPANVYPPADIQYGSQIYAAQCSGCHGPDGDAVTGIDLRANLFRRVISDEDLRATVTGGVPGTGMPPFKFNPSELAGIVAYVRNMRQVDAQAVTIGDAQRGQRLFEGTGNCLSCHRVSGRGSRVGPELTEIGAVRTASSLQRSLIDPTAAMVPSNRSVRAVTRNGQVITGRRLNEDSYTLQLIDDHERLVSLAKADLRQFTVLTTSPMPSYKDARAQDIADVLAYLLSLKGSK